MNVCISTRKLVLIGVGVITLIGGAAVAIFAGGSHDAEPSKHSAFPFVVLVPIYTSLIPVYIAAARRRRNKKTDG